MVKSKVRTSSQVCFCYHSDWKRSIYCNRTVSTLDHVAFTKVHDQSSIAVDDVYMSTPGTVLDAVPEISDLEKGK